MMVMHQSIILAAPMPLQTHTPPPPPLPRALVFFALDGKFLGEGIVELSHTLWHAQMLCNWYLKAQLATLPTCLQ